MHVFHQHYQLSSWLGYQLHNSAASPLLICLIQVQYHLVPWEQMNDHKCWWNNKIPCNRAADSNWASEDGRISILLCVLSYDSLKSWRLYSTQVLWLLRQMCHDYYHIQTYMWCLPPWLWNIFMWRQMLPDAIFYLHIKW